MCRSALCSTFAFTLALLLLGAFGLTGCSLQSDRAVASSVPGRAVQGRVHGGVFPIQGATIRLMETQSNGYGGAAKQLLQTTSDNNGFFTFPDTGWSCDVGQFAYVTVTSGHTGSNAMNNNVGQIGIIGDCGQLLSTTAEIDAVQVYVSELSTIAAAYTLRGFITVDDTNAASGQQIINISAPPNNNTPSGVCTFNTPTTCVAAGLAHGFKNAYNLVDSVSFNGVLPSGSARTTIPVNGNAHVPTEMINTLGNILQSCVDSAGGTVGNYAAYAPGGNGSNVCGDLFYYSTPAGGSSPTNTLEAALSMASFPTNNAAQLFALQPRAVFFTPTLTSTPNDLSLSIFYLTEDFSASASTLTNPMGVALDANDDAFVLVTTASGAAQPATAVLGLSNNGAVLFSGPLSSTYLTPSNIVTDALDNIWFTNNSAATGAVLKANPSTGQIALGTTLPNAAGLAVDRFNNVWVSVDASSAASLLEYSSASLSGGAATPLLSSNPLGTGLSNLAIDSRQNIWSLNTHSAPSAAVLLPNNGTANAPSYGQLLSSQPLNGSAGSGAAFNAAGEAFFPLGNEVDDAQFTGALLSVDNLGIFNGNAQINARYNVPNQVDIDGAGAVFWTDTEANGKVFQFVPPSQGSLAQGKLTALVPCYPVNRACYVPAVSNGRGMQIDSTGALWYVADAAFLGVPIGVVIQTFGVAAPTWPQQSLGLPGVKPQ